MDERLSPRLAAIVDALPLAPGMRVLEIGCGLVLRRVRSRRESAMVISWRSIARPGRSIWHGVRVRRDRVGSIELAPRVGRRLRTRARRGALRPRFRRSRRGAGRAPSGGWQAGAAAHRRRPGAQWPAVHRRRRAVARDSAREVTRRAGVALGGHHITVAWLRNGPEFRSSTKTSKSAIDAVDTAMPCLHKALAVGASAPPAGSLAARLRTVGGVPEWLKGTDCKSVGFAYVGSNPTPSTIPPSDSAGRRGRRKMTQGAKATRNAAKTKKEVE